MWGGEAAAGLRWQDDAETAAKRRAKLRASASARRLYADQGRERSLAEQAVINDVMMPWRHKSRAKRRQEMREGRHESHEGRHCCHHCLLFRVAGPNNALVKTGLGLSRPRPQVSGCVCYVPCCQWVDVMDLTAMQLRVQTNDMITANGVTVDVSGLFIVRIDPGDEWSPRSRGPLPTEPAPEPEPVTHVRHSKRDRLLRLSSNPDRATGIRVPTPGPVAQPQKLSRALCYSRQTSKDAISPFEDPLPPRDPLAPLRRAASQFAGWSKAQIEARVTETLAGHQRSVLSEITVPELISDRMVLEARMREVVSADLAKFGMRLLSYLLPYSIWHGYSTYMHTYTHTYNIHAISYPGVIVHTYFTRIVYMHIYVCCTERRYTILDMSDKLGYLKAFGATALAEVKRDARMGVAQERSEAEQQLAIYSAQKAKVKWQAAIETAEWRGRHALYLPRSIIGANHNRHTEF